MINMDVKAFYKSKLFWWGMVQIVIGVLSLVDGYITNGTAITASGIITIILRVLTTQPIGLTDSNQ